MAPPARVLKTQDFLLPRSKYSDPCLLSIVDFNTRFIVAVDRHGGAAFDRFVTKFDIVLLVVQLQPHAARYDERVAQGLGQALDARRRIHRITDGRVFMPRGRPDVADDDFSQVQPDADRDRLEPLLPEA